MNTMTDMTDRAFEIIHEITGNITGMLRATALISLAFVSHKICVSRPSAVRRGNHSAQ